MNPAAATTREPVTRTRTAGAVWGLSVTGLHERFWASHGVQIVRPGGDPIRRAGPATYMLLERHDLVLTALPPVVAEMIDLPRGALRLTVDDRVDEGYAELVESDPNDRLLRVRRDYSGNTGRRLAVTVTPDPDIAEAWQRSAGGREALRDIRALVDLRHYRFATTSGCVLDGRRDTDRGRCMRSIMRRWERPDRWLTGVRRHGRGVFGHRSTRVDPGARFTPPVWLGAGRTVRREQLVVGPWVAPDHRPVTPSRLRFGPLQTEPPAPDDVATAPRSRGKRIFDVTFAAAALVVLAPVFLLIMIVIWFQDGRPFFFAHRRQTLGGREFNCYKFRTMCRDAEVLKSTLAERDAADGPQFNIQNDPRLSRCGRVLRRFHLDELPQFWNVLRGHMSVVGPRPSPSSENQICPAWREARLSVRPGVTGLWQIRRTRQPDRDFQEWIRYDIEYVRRRNWRMDLRILLGTLRAVITGR